MRCWRGESVAAEIREVDDDGDVHMSTDAVESVVAEGPVGGFGMSFNDVFERRSTAMSKMGNGASFGNGSSHEAPLRNRMGSRPRNAATGPHQKVYPLGVSLSRLREAIRETGTNVSIAERVEEADVLLTLRASFRRRPPELRLAESRRLPVVVLKHNTVLQMEKSLRALSKGSSPNDAVTAALAEAEEAISQIHSGRQSAVDLAPPEFLHPQVATSVGHGPGVGVGEQGSGAEPSSADPCRLSRPPSSIEASSSPSRAGMERARRRWRGRWRSAWVGLAERFG